MALFVPLDVDFQDDPKIIAAGYLGECLFNRSLALAKRLMDDGKIDRHHLPRLWLGLPGKPEKSVAALVSGGLWTETPSGWVITSWLKRNQAADDIKEKAARKKASALAANHQRWHVDTGKPSDTCPLCYPKLDPVGSDSESTELEPQSETESYPEEESLIGSTFQQQLESDPPAIAAAALDLFMEWRVAKGDVDNPGALRRTVIRDDAMKVNDYLAAYPDASPLDVAVDVHSMARPRPQLVTTTTTSDVVCGPCDGTGQLASRKTPGATITCRWCDGSGQRTITSTEQVAQ